jgi:hypothetical protein
LSADYSHKFNLRYKSSFKPFEILLS